MEQVLNKIFLERTESEYQFRFGDFYNTMTDYFNEHHIDYMKYTSYDDREESTISTLTMCIFSLLKTYKNSHQQRSMVTNYITRLCMLINTTNHMIENNLLDVSSIISNIRSYFICECGNSNIEINSESIPYVISNHLFEIDYTDFNSIKKIINTIFSDKYHDDYIIQLSLGTLAFTSLIDEENNKIELISIYLKNLKEMNKLSDKFNFYDKPNYRGYIKF
jgi:hypothetical protein